jgi:hypothetical protein
MSRRLRASAAPSSVGVSDQRRMAASGVAPLGGRVTTIEWSSSPRSRRGLRSVILVPDCTRVQARSRSAADQCLRVRVGAASGAVAAPFGAVSRATTDTRGVRTAVSRAIHAAPTATTKAHVARRRRSFRGFDSVHEIRRQRRIQMSSFVFAGQARSGERSRFMGESAAETRW